MKFDVIIATYNRKDSLQILVDQIYQCKKQPENIIIIDSSDTENNSIQKLNLVKYRHTKHKNQPYQRYLGFLLSKSDILVYFDDDMRITDNKCFTKLIDIFRQKDIAGIQPNFSYRNLFFDEKMPNSTTRELAKQNVFFKALKFFSGNPNIKKGTFWLAGIRGGMPRNRESMQWFNGPVFLAKKQFLYKNFNFSLFNIYEKKIGKSEDSILGHTLSYFGEIIFINDLFFEHDDQGDSSYTLDFSSFGMRVAYSRLFLSFEYSRLAKKSLLVAFLHFNLYILGRIVSMIVNQVFDFKKSRKYLLRGYLKGYFRALANLNNLSKYDNGSGWNKIAQNEINQKN